MKKEQDVMGIDNRDYDQYVEERKILVESHRMSSQAFDKAILTLASGSFGFTFAFLKDLVPNPIESTMCLLHFAWLYFAICILIILLSFIFSQKACLKQIDITYSKIIEKNNNIKNIWGTITTTLNYASIVLLIVAYIYWGYFIYLNYK